MKLIEIVHIVPIPHYEMKSIYWSLVMKKVVLLNKTNFAE